MVNKKRSIIVLLIPALVLCFSFHTSFADTGSAITTPPAVENVKVKSLSLDAKRLIFAKKGDTLTLVATVQPAKAFPASIKFTSSNKKIATVTSKGVVKAKGWGECTITAKVDGIKKTCQVSVANKWVAITFDDGPGKYTNKLLKGLKKQKVQATFFVVGSMAKSNKSVLKNVYKNGHEISNHTYNHKAGAATLKGQLSKTDKIIKSVTGKNSTLMRPPGGVINNGTKKCGKSIIMWSVDPKDWRDRNASTVRSRVLKSTKSGSIILLHDIHPTSVTAALNITKDLKKRGYTFVTVSDIIGKPKANKTYFKGRSKVKTMKIK